MIAIKMKKIFIHPSENISHLCMKNNPSHMSTYGAEALIYAVSNLKFIPISKTLYINLLVDVIMQLDRE